MCASKSLRIPLVFSSITTAFALAALFLLVISARASSAVRDVCPSGCPYTTIQAAVQAAADGDTIRVAQGSYTGMMTTTVLSGGENASATITATVILTKNIILLGGYNPDRSQCNPDQFVTTIDGQQAGWPVVVILGSQSKIDGFHIVRGHSQAGGSGVWVGDQPGQATRTMISRNTITGNRVPDGAPGNPSGAGILVQGSVQATLSQNKILTNTIEAENGFGAGIAIRDGASVVIEGNTIAYNRTLPLGSSGGGIYITSASATIIGNAIQENQSGGIEVHDSPSTWITSNTISKNLASKGAGVWITGSTVYTITGNVISENHSASQGGGGLLIQGSSGQVIENSLLNNQAVQGGGGLALSVTDGFVEVRNNQILLNTAGYGGGVLVSGLTGANTSLLLAANDIRNNMTTNASSQAGGIHLETISDLPVTIVNNVIAGNQGRGVKSVDSGEVSLLNNTIVNNGLVGAEFSSAAEPRTAVVTNNIFAGHSDCAVNGASGAVLWISYSVFSENKVAECGEWTGERNRSGELIFANPSLGDYHIRIGSAALNAGTPSSIAAFDKDDIPRPQGLQFDAGAYEMFVYHFILPFVAGSR